jgi:outer membrane protein OmpA-like peptidoglycan-associated protein
MKKIMFLAALFMGATISAFAQSTETVTETRTVKETVTDQTERQSFWSNTFLSVGVGGQMLFGDHEKEMKFGDRISPALDIAFGKWITPEVGVRLMFSSWRINGATQNNELSDGGAVDGKPWFGYWLTDQKINYMNLHGEVMFNLSNLFCGYNPKRIWNVSPYIGMGWMRIFSDEKTNEIGANLGIYNSFRLSDALDLNLDVRGTLVNDDFDGERGGRNEEGVLSATVGLSYKFKPRGFKSKVITILDQTEIDRLRQQMNELNAENERLKNKPAETITNTELLLKEIVAPCMVVFPINTANLSQDERVNLSMFAENVKKQDKGIVYSITGYADAATGTKEINDPLSKARAEAVYRCLVDEFGISESQLIIDYKGGVENMFYDNPAMSRAVIVRIHSIPENLK